MIQYIHVKDVLEEHFGPLMTRLKEENRRATGYYLQLPGESNVIPTSLISQRLNDDLTQMKSQFENESDSSKDNDAIALELQTYITKIGFEIIFAFQLLYYKYIDSQNACAPFMINISYRNRSSLKVLFDFKYFEREKQGSLAPILMNKLLNANVKIKFVQMENICV